jgi:hypothetical protein
VVASQQYYVLGILHLVTEEQFNRFHRVVTPVHEITYENIPSGRQLPSHFEKLQHIEKLSMNITAYCDWRLGLLYITLLKEQLFYLVAERSYYFFLKIFAGF